MRTPFERIQTCADVDDEALTRAASDRIHFRNLVSRMASIATPGSGAVKILLVCARVVKSQASWTEGALRVNLTARGNGTDVEVLSESAGLIERLFPPFAFAVPLSEFTNVAEKAPHLIAPLVVVSSHPSKLMLTGDPPRESTVTGPLSVPPPPTSAQRPSVSPSVVLPKSLAPPLTVPRPTRRGPA